MEALPRELRLHEDLLMDHPVLEHLQGLPRAIWQTAPLLRQGKSMSDLEMEFSEEHSRHAEDSEGLTPTGGRGASSEGAATVHTADAACVTVGGVPLVTSRPGGDSLAQDDALLPTSLPPTPASSAGAQWPIGSSVGALGGHEHGRGTPPAAAAPQPALRTDGEAFSQPAADASADGGRDAAASASAASCTDAVLPGEEEPVRAGGEGSRQCARASAPSGAAVGVDGGDESHGTSGGALLLPDAASGLEIAAARRQEEARFSKSLRRSLEVSLRFLQRTNAQAFNLLAVLTLLPGGALEADLDAIWSPSMRAHARARGGAGASGNGSRAEDAAPAMEMGAASPAATTTCAASPAAASAWRPLIQVLMQPPEAHSEPQGQWLVRRTQLSGGGRQSYTVSAREAAKTLDSLPSELARIFAERCAIYFSSLGERLVAALEKGGERVAEWRSLFLECVEANMWACLNSTRLNVLGAPRHSSAAAASHTSHTGPSLDSTGSAPIDATAAVATAHVGNALARILALLGRRQEAASAAEATVGACEALGTAGSGPAAQALALLGDMRLQLGQLGDAQVALQHAVRAFAASSDGSKFSEQLRSSLPPPSGWLPALIPPPTLLEAAVAPAALGVLLPASSASFCSALLTSALSSTAISSSAGSASPPASTQSSAKPGAPPLLRGADGAATAEANRLPAATLALAPRGGSSQGGKNRHSPPLDTDAGLAILPPPDDSPSHSNHASALGEAIVDASPGLPTPQLQGANGLRISAPQPTPGGAAVDTSSADLFDDDDEEPVSPGRKRAAHNSRSRWNFLKWHVFRERVSGASGGGPVLALLTLGDVHFASATEAAQRGEPREVVHEQLCQAESIFSAALSAVPRLSPMASPTLRHRRLERIASPIGSSSPPPRDQHGDGASRDGGSADGGAATGGGEDDQGLHKNDQDDQDDQGRGGDYSLSEGRARGRGEGKGGAAVSSTYMRATVSLAKVALARHDESRCLHLLAELPDTEAVVVQLRGEAHAAMGELDRARTQLTEAARLWRRAGDGMHEQAVLLELERVRKSIEAHHDGAGRLVVFHAAPLVESVPQTHPDLAGGSASMGGAGSEGAAAKKLQPIAFSKRLGLRAWRALRASLASLHKEINVSLELATVEGLVQALQQSDSPMLHFLPTREYTDGISMETYEGELKPLPLQILKELLERHAPRRPSLVFCCARHSVEAGYVFLNAGVPVVVCLRGFLPEEAISEFVHEFYRRLLSGSPPHEAFVAAELKQKESVSARSFGKFELLMAEGADDTATIAVPGPGELRDTSPKLCPSNLPLFRDKEDREERPSLLEQQQVDGDGDGAGDGAPRPRADDSYASTADLQFDESGVEMLAHGRTFVGRHLEVHELVKSCLYNHLTAVYGDTGAGKSSLILEAARYMRQRNRFPHGIFCCSLEGIRSMKAVRARLGQTLNIPARSAPDLHDLMSRFSSCLLILDRCEDAIRVRRTPFYWFLTQLLQQSTVKVIISSQEPMEDPRFFAERGIVSSEVALGEMRPRDSALLLLESCERDIHASELGLTEEDEANGISIIDALAAHPLLSSIRGMPAAVRWAARRLADVTLPALLEELKALTPMDLQATVLSSTDKMPELQPRDIPRPFTARRTPSMSAPAFCTTLDKLSEPNDGSGNSGHGASACGASGAAMFCRRQRDWSSQRQSSGGLRLSPISSCGDDGLTPRESPAHGAPHQRHQHQVHHHQKHPHQSFSPMVGSTTAPAYGMVRTPSPPGASYRPQPLPPPSSTPAEHHLRTVQHAMQEMRAAGQPSSAEFNAELRALVTTLQDMVGDVRSSQQPPLPSTPVSRRHAQQPSCSSGSSLGRQRSGSGGKWNHTRSSSGRKLSWESRQMREMAVLSNAHHYDADGVPNDEDDVLLNASMHGWMRD